MELPDRITKRTDKRLSNIGYKKVFCKDGNEVVLLLSMNEEDNIEKILLPSSYGVARSVKVLAIYDMWGYKTCLTEAYSHWDRDFKYEVGKTYSPQNGIWYWPRFRQAQAYWLNAGGVTDKRFQRIVNYIKSK